MFAKKGFTLLEILLAVGAISILAGIVIVAINPGKQLATARNTTRLVDVHTIADAIYQYTLDHDGTLPGSFTSSTFTMLGTTSGGCATLCGAQADSNWNSNQSFGDQSASDFGSGSLNNVTYDNTNSGLKISAGTGGSFTSRTIDSGSPGTTWSTLSWVPSFPTYKELSNNAQKESGYLAGNVDMTGNLVLLHLNESAGKTNFAETSGANNNTVCGGIVCPVMSGLGKFNTAAHFDGLNDFLQIAANSTLKYTGGEMTISLWINPDVTETTGGYLISKPWNGNGQYNYTLSYSGSGGNGTVGFCVAASSGNCINTSKRLLEGVWTHVVATVSPSSIKVFLNGVENVSTKNTITNWVPSKGDIHNVVSIGTLFPYSFSWGGLDTFSFNGSMDEIAFFNRAISPTEILDMYKRGAATLKLQVRSCADGSCNGSNFAGPDGTDGSYYSELANTTISPPVLPLNVQAKRYLQYKVILGSDNGSFSPLLKSVSIAADVPAPVAASSENTPEACLDLSPTLMNDGYISALPFDPQQGTADKTFYAVKIEDNGKIMVKSCRSELGQDISTVR